MHGPGDLQQNYSLNETAEMASPRTDARTPGKSASDKAGGLGHAAARNPAYAGKRFEEIEDDLLKSWSGDLRDSHGEWASVRGFAQEAYGQRPRGQR